MALDKDQKHETSVALGKGEPPAHMGWRRVCEEMITSYGYTVGHTHHHLHEIELTLDK